MRIEVTNGAMRFGQLTAFSNFSFTFPANSLSALTGPSGSGKSTLLSAIAGYASLSAGTIRLGETGELLPAPSFVAWVPQGSNALAARSALDNVMVGALSTGMQLDAAKSRARFELDRVQMSGRSETLVKHLSGGELQRVSFARALSTGSPIILADEPSASLDAAHTEQLAELLIMLRSTTTIVVATHDPILISATERTAHMREA